MNNQPVIELQQVSKIVTSGTSELIILKDISLAVADSESLAIIGPSGSGKTTLLSLMAGLDIPSHGTVKLLGTDITQLSEDGRAITRRNKVGMVFQTFQLLAHLTALDNVMLPLQLAGETNANDIAAEWLTKVGLAERQHHLPNALSGGEQQRVAIARAFAINPAILFADEPTGNLDTQSGHQIAKLLFELNANHGTTLIIVTHDEYLANQCQRSLQLLGGQLQ